MKLVTRKALLAGATAATVAFAGINVATAETATTPAETPAPTATATVTPSSTPAQTPAPVTVTVAPTTQDASSALSSGNSSEVNPRDITAWISVFTAVIGALGTLFTFLARNFNLSF